MKKYHLSVSLSVTLPVLCERSNLNDKKKGTFLSGIVCWRVESDQSSPEVL